VSRNREHSLNCRCGTLSFDNSSDHGCAGKKSLGECDFFSASISALQFSAHSIFFRGSWVGAAMMRPPSLKKRLGERRHPAPTLQHIPASNIKCDISDKV